MAITIGDVLNNMDLFYGILEVRVINDKRTTYSIVSATELLDVEARSIRTFEGIEPKTIVTVFSEDLVKTDTIEKQEEELVEENEYLNTVKHELEINDFWDKRYKRCFKSNDNTLSIFDINFNNYDIDYLKFLLSGSVEMVGENKLYTNFIDFIVQKTDINKDSIEDTNWELVYEKQREAFFILEEKIIIKFEKLSKNQEPFKLTQKKYIEWAKKYLIDNLGKKLKELFEEPNNIYKVELRLKSSYDKLKAD